ncbi:MAG: hypothetical protein WA746_00320, partial [Isosphaeraceae bacterium]
EERLRSAIQSGACGYSRHHRRRRSRPGPVALAPHLPEAQQAGVYAEALDGARAITDLSERAWVLEALAPHLAVLSRAITVTNNITAEWQESVCILAASGRPALLNGLKALMPWLVTLARPPMLREIAVTIRDVSRCWP